MKAVLIYKYESEYRNACLPQAAETKECGHCEDPARDAGDAGIS
jgi:hypothetical protein